MVPVLEGLGNVKIDDSLSYLEQLSSELFVVLITLLEGFPKSSFDPALVFFDELLRSITHVLGDCSPLEPLSDSFSLSHVQHILVQDFLLGSKGLQHSSHIQECVVSKAQFL